MYANQFSDFEAKKKVNIVCKWYYFFPKYDFQEWDSTTQLILIFSAIAR